jgi:hypothetical protein
MQEGAEIRQVLKPEIHEAGQARAQAGTISEHVLPSSRAGTFLAGLLVACPAVIFYSILVRKALNIPFLDDYDALLDFLNRLTTIKGASAKALYVLTLQHNEYKVFFGEGVAWLQFALCGQVDFRILSAIGNGFVFLLAILLWKMFLPNHKDLATRLALFIPVPWLLFQLAYFETLDWAMAGLQNIPVLFFSLGAIYLLVRGERWAFCSAWVFLVLAVSSSGNGLIAIPIGVLILAWGRYYVRLAAWLSVSAGCVAIYAYRYNPMMSQTNHQRSVFATLLHLNPGYVVAFIGNAAVGSRFLAISLLLGILLCAFFAWMAYRGYIRTNPQVSCCVLFLLLTAIGVAGLRSDFGVAQSLSSRYTIYSVLFLIFAWFAIAEEFLEHRRAPVFGSNIFLGAAALAVLFSLLADGYGSMLLEGRDRALVQAMTAFEHPISPRIPVGPAPSPEPSSSRAESDSFNLRARSILDESMKLGIYRPPSF